MNISITLFIAAIAIASAALWMSMRKKAIVDLAEFSKLNDDLKNLYRTTVVDIAMPLAAKGINDGWNKLSETRKEQIRAAAKKAAGASNEMSALYLPLLLTGI